MNGRVRARQEGGVSPLGASPTDDRRPEGLTPTESPWTGLVRSGGGEDQQAVSNSICVVTLLRPVRLAR